MVNKSDQIDKLYEKYKNIGLKRKIETPKVSIIIPAYNVEKYIAECLESIIKQTFQELEIIVINDSSTDRTLSIIEVFSNIDSRIKVITQQNQGVSAARNTGINIAKGEYITFIDSDDWIDENYIEELYNAIIKYDCDIAASTIIRKRTHSQKYRVHYTAEKVYTTLKDKIETCRIPVCCYIWNKLYKSNLVKENLFKNGVYYEDMLWIPDILKHSDKFVTVPNINYYYRVNKSSIVKKVQSPKKQMDLYNACKYILNFFKENDLQLPKKSQVITKSIKYLFGIPILKVKEFNGFDTTWLFGFLPIKKIPSDKIFLVFNTACFGDVLLCNSLCQNIKNIFPNSKVVFICDKNFYEAARYQKDVDDVIIYDKNGEHKGLIGMLNFIKSFPYKKPFASFITYVNIRNNFVAKLLGSKFVINGKRIITTKVSAQYQHLNLLKHITNSELINYPIKYLADNNIPKHLQYEFNPEKQYIGLCTLTKNPPKDMPIETAAKLIKKFNNDGIYEILFLGVGEKCKIYAENLRKLGCRFTDLVGKTTIYELGEVIKNCKGLISVDTGTMHLGCAIETPTIAVFYELITLPNWTPNPNLYNAITIASNQTAENIYSAMMSLLNKEEPKVTVVIPTLQKNVDLLLNLIKTLEQDRVVSEILLIDNSCKGLDYKSEKLRIIIPGKNMYVNPSWNYGVKEAKNEIVALLNDDITVAPNFCGNVASKMTRNMGGIGACMHNIKETKTIEYSINDSEFTLTPINLITHHWGIAIFFYKSSYVDIPDEMKIFRGDDWIFYQNKLIGRQNYYIDGQNIYHYGSLTSRSKALKPIGKRDRYFYRKYTQKWYQNYFNVEELSDGYRLTLCGFKIIIKDKEKHFAI